MAKYLVETYYTCNFKVKHYLDELSEDLLSKLDQREDGKLDIINVKHPVKFFLSILFDAAKSKLDELPIKFILTFFILPLIKKPLPCLVFWKILNKLFFLLNSYSIPSLKKKSTFLNFLLLSIILE